MTLKPEKNKAFFIDQKRIEQEWPVFSRSSLVEKNQLIPFHTFFHKQHGYLWTDPKKEKPRLAQKTPPEVKEFFKDFIFPCQGNKKPAVPKRTNWQDWKGDTESIGLAGLNCGKAGLVVFDFDIYKDDFKKSKQSKELYKKVKRLSQFKQTTQSGGEHYFFKQPEGQTISNKDSSLPKGIEIRGAGGYACLYQLPFLPASGIETFEELYKMLPDFPCEILKELDKEKSAKEKQTPGEGKNNEWLNSGFGTFANGDPAQIKNKIIEIVKGYLKTPGKTSKTEAKEKLKKSLKDGLKKNNKLDFVNEFPDQIIDKVFEIEKSAGKNFESKDKDKLKQLFSDRLKEKKHISDKVIFPQKNESREIKTAIHFIPDLLLDHNFNLIGGDPKLGKSRIFYKIVGKHLKKKKIKGLVYSTENQKEIFFNPLLKKLDYLDQFIIYDTPIQFSLETKQNKKIEIFLDWFEKLVKENQDCKFFCIDPLPKFIDWNKEPQVSYFLENGLMKTARENQVCILGFRNAGKEDYKDLYNTKGSSAIQDTVRQILTAQSIDEKSAIGQKIDGKGTLIYTAMSSYFDLTARVYKLKVDKLENADVAIPIDLTESLSDLLTETISKKGKEPITKKRSIKEIRYLCSKESGKSAFGQIISYMKENKLDYITLAEAKEGLHHILGDTIQKALTRNFKSVKKGKNPTMYFMEKVDSEKEKVDSEKEK